MGLEFLKKFLKKLDNCPHTYPILILMAIILFVNRNLFLKGGSFETNDSFGGHIALISFFSSDSRFFDLWNETSFGFFTPLNFIKILAFVTNILGDAIFVFNVTIFLTMLGTAIGMYLVVYYFTCDRRASFVSAFAFTFNQWIVAKYASGHLMHVVPYFLLPILFLFLCKSLSSGKLKDIIMFSIILSIFPLMRLDPLYYVAPFVILFFVVSIIYNKVYNKSSDIVRVLKVGSISSILFIFLTFYIFIPVSNISTPYSSVEFPLSEIEMYSLSIYDSMLGFTTSVTSNIYWLGGLSWNTHPFLPIPIYKLLMFIIPFLAILAIFLKRNTMIVSLTIIAMISIFLAKGPNDPFGGIYIWAYENLPYFSGLHVPNRWLMMTWFAYAFLIGISVSEINKRIQTVKKIHNISYSEIMITFIISVSIISIFIGSYYIFVYGYQTYNPQKQEIEPHQWISNNKEEFRVVTVPFSQVYMFLEEGNREHDIGRSGYFFHKKPTANIIYGNGKKFDSPVTSFFNFIKGLVDSREDSKLGKIMGIYDIRYFVIQGYPVTPSVPPNRIDRVRYSEHKYFEKQEGLTKVFESDYIPYKLKISYPLPHVAIEKNIPLKYSEIEIKRPARVYENSYWTQRIFIPRDQMLVVGGLETFPKLAEIDRFKFDKWNILFADQLEKNTLVEQINNSSYVTFVNSEPLDLAILLTNEMWIKVSEFEKDSKGWIKDNSIITRGLFVYNRDIISTDKDNAKVTYNVDIKNDSRYDIWIRAFLDYKSGDIKIFVDGMLLSKIDTGSIYSVQKLSKKSGFKWIKVKDIKLTKGAHILDIISEHGYNKLNGILISKKGNIDSVLNYTIDTINKKSIYLIDIDNAKNVENEIKNIDGNIILYRDDKPIKSADIKIKKDDSNAIYISTDKIQPSKWKIKVNSNGPYTLIFSDTYNDMWRAYVNDKEYQSIPSYYFINSFQIDEIGEHEVVIEFIGQRIQNIGMLISILTYFGCIGYILYDWRRKNKDNIR